VTTNNFTFTDYDCPQKALAFAGNRLFEEKTLFLKITFAPNGRHP
jgi:hypothetical protein